MNSIIAIVAYIVFAAAIILIVDMARWALKQVELHFERRTENE